MLLQCIMLPSGASSKKPGKSQKTRLRTIANGLRKIHIDEEVKIALTLSLERFSYSDQKGLFCVPLAFSKMCFRADAFNIHAPL